MGFARRLISGLNRAERATSDLELSVFRDRRFERAEELAAAGRADEAVVTGIRRRLNDSTTETRVRLEWFAPEPRRAALAWGEDLPLVVRLGATVRVRTDAKEVALDLAAMPDHGGGPHDPGRRSRTVPEPGLDDRALDARVLSRLRKWPAEPAVVAAVVQARALHLTTRNWDVVLRRADGTTATISRDEVPPYVQWFVAPGELIPVVIDPRDPTRAQGDWPRLAQERAVAGGRWSDSPADGSIAAARRGDSEPTAAAAVSDQVQRPAAPGVGPSIEGVTIERCAQIEAALTASRIPPADHDAVAAAEHGVEPGRWSAIRAGWHARMREDWRIGAAYGAAYEAASGH